MNIFRSSINTIKICEHYECSGNVSKYLTAYKCPAGVWTIGIGTTVYPTGIKVKQGDKITLMQAYEYFKYEIRTIECFVESVVKKNINQEQYDALVDFAYNCGKSALKDSTLLKKININPFDTSIEFEFLRWNKASGVPLEGLTKRRKTESILFTKGILQLF